MTGLRHTALALGALALLAAAPARATQLCGWMTETVDEDGVDMFDLWLQADGEVSFLYKMTGQGVYSEGSRAYSPGSGSFSLHPGKAEKPWGFGTNLDKPGEIDMTAEIHVPPASIFSEEETPLLASFTFRRHVAEDEAKPPATFATKQCVTLPASH